MAVTEGHVGGVIFVPEALGASDAGGISHGVTIAGQIRQWSPHVFVGRAGPLPIAEQYRFRGSANLIDLRRRLDSFSLSSTNVARVVVVTRIWVGQST